MITDKQKQKIREMWADEKTSGEIAEKLNLTRNTVMGYVHRCKQKGLLQDHGGAGRGGGRKPGQKPDPAKAAPAPKLIKRRIPYERKPAPWLAPLFESNRAGVTLMQLKEAHCRFILGEVKGYETRYCGQPKVGKSMCAEHHALCYTAPPTRAEVKRNKTAFRYGRMMPLKNAAEG